ncbi:MAG: hypothetical protein E6R05_02735 [Candidatus Moraniibacteriota bacterium]|nr:MAG: hypothetical protein E6R05_02735 [Candidatus Moranbacteria bacterium]
MNSPEQFRISPEGGTILAGYLISGILFASEVVYPPMVIPALLAFIATTGYAVHILRKHNKDHNS